MEWIRYLNRKSLEVALKNMNLKLMNHDVSDVGEPHTFKYIEKT